MRKGISVVMAGVGINLALGILYTWSIFKDSISKSIDDADGKFTWSKESVNDPYAVALIAFAFMMVAAGKIQDKFGPRITAFAGGIMVGAGFIWISQTTGYLEWILGFGVLAGTGIAFGYSSATPPALKWFPPEKTGMIAGIVVSGFGMASVYIAPLARYWVTTFGLNKAMLFFGIAFMAAVSVFSLFLKNPPGAENPGKKAEGEVSVAGLFKDGRFYILWILYFIGSGAGLMVISHVNGMAAKSMGEAAFWAVAILSIGNASGRIVAGMLSDKIGRKKTLMMMLAFQAVLMFLAMATLESNPSTLFILLLATFMGFNFGTNLSLFPSFTKDLWGLKNFGVFYGIVFTAWGVGGFVLSRLSQMLKVFSGNLSSSFMVAGIMLLVAVGLTLLLKKEEK